MASESTPLLDGSRETSWRVAASCAGFMADSYDLFTIDLVVVILQLTYGETVFGPHEVSITVSMMLVGLVVGQVTFGVLADSIGRKSAAVMTSALTVIGALASAFCVNLPGSSLGLPQQLALCRGILGVGVGGEYPISATITSESASDSQSRARLLALVISMQGFGMLLSSLLALGALHLGISLETLWRVLLGFGALPSAVAFVMRRSMHETEAYVHRASTGEESKLAVMQRYKGLLAGTAGTWFLMNLFSYSMGSFKSTIISDALPSHGDPAHERVLRVAEYSAIQAGFAIAGFALGHMLIGCVSRFFMQISGFAASTLVFASVSGLYVRHTPPSATILLAALGAMYICLNAGPNITTYLLPAEIYPTQVRATCHGLSAAVGKLGAALGTAAFPWLEEAGGLGNVFGTCMLSSAAAVLLTYACTPREVNKLRDLDKEIL
mmetsp:Transcript_28510/g.51571  ORF Transcript_28510/g.51571 Transcript_28510/m.51571 type:complete len:440 (-) Transcript_28510:7-1326(-)